MRMRRRALVALAVIVAVGVGALLMMDSVVRQMIYPAPPVRVPSPPPAPLVEVPLEAGGHAYRPGNCSRRRRGPGALAPGADAPRNGENLETMRQAGPSRLTATPRRRVAIDYPGYGSSAGKPSEEATRRREAAWSGLGRTARGVRRW